MAGKLVSSAGGSSSGVVVEHGVRARGDGEAWGGGWDGWMEEEEGTLDVRCFGENMGGHGAVALRGRDLGQSLAERWQ